MERRERETHMEGTTAMMTILIAGVAISLIGLWVARTTAAPTSAHQTDVAPISNQPTPVIERITKVTPPNGQQVRTSATFHVSKFLTLGQFGAISRAFAIGSSSVPGQFLAHLSDAFSPVRTNTTLFRPFCMQHAFITWLMTENHAS